MDHATIEDLVAATDAERRKQTHYRDCKTRTKLVPFALETYGAFSDRSDRFLVKCATIASGEYVGLGLVCMQDLLACCAHGNVKECRLHCDGR